MEIFLVDIYPMGGMEHAVLATKVVHFWNFYYLGGVEHAVWGAKAVKRLRRVHARAADSGRSREIDGGVHDPQRELATLLFGHCRRGWRGASEKRAGSREINC